MNIKAYYDEQSDSLYLTLSDQKPDGVVEIADGVNLDTTIDGKIYGIEILNASNRLNLDTLFSYALELNPTLFKQKSAIPNF